MTAPKPIVFRDYSIGFRVTSELLEDADYHALQSHLDECRAATATALADRLYEDLAGEPRQLLDSWWVKDKKWLGWKLWRLALSLNHDID